MLENIQIGLIVVLVVSAITLGVLLYNCESKEKFNLCGTCQGMSTKVCPDRRLTSHLYQTSQLTENSARERQPGWPSFSWDSFQSYEDKKHPCRKSL